MSLKNKLGHFLAEAYAFIIGSHIQIDSRKEEVLFLKFFCIILLLCCCLLKHGTIAQLWLPLYVSPFSWRKEKLAAFLGKIFPF